MVAIRKSYLSFLKGGKPELALESCGTYLCAVWILSLVMGFQVVRVVAVCTPVCSELVHKEIDLSFK